jgi:hypothetical protein
MTSQRYEDRYTITLTFCFDLTDDEYNRLEQCGIKRGATFFSLELLHNFGERPTRSLRLMRKEFGRRPFMIREITRIKSHIIKLDLTKGPIFLYNPMHFETVVENLFVNLHLPSIKYVHWKCLLQPHEPTR